MYFLVYVDDIIVTGSSSTAIAHLTATLATTFVVRDLGDIHYFLGIEVNHTRDGLHLSQSKYIIDILQRYKLDEAKPCLTPLQANIQLSRLEGQPLEDSSYYRQLVGTLQYCTLTRPDIAFVVNKVCQFMHSPTKDHLQAVKRIFRYLKGTIHHGLLLQRSSSFDLHAFSDAN